MKQADRNEKVAMDMATLLTWLGNISDSTNQVVGAKVIAYLAVATISEISMMTLQPYHVKASKKSKDLIGITSKFNGELVDGHKMPAKVSRRYFRNING